MQCRDVVDSRRHAISGVRRDCRAKIGKIGAHICEHIRPQRENAAVGVKRQRAIALMIAAMILGEEEFAALGLPTHRPREFPRRIENQCFFRIRRDPRAEAAAHIGNQNSKAVLRDVQHFAREHAPHQMRRLATGMQCQLIALVIVNSDRNARLHRVGHDPVVDEREAHDMPTPSPSRHRRRRRRRSRKRPQRCR